MGYDLRAGSGLRGGASKLREHEDVNPMASTANIVDAMLVLAVGLMIAVIAFWNVDTSQLQELIAQDEVTEMDDIEELADEMTSAGSNYSEIGTVYQDPETGQLYMLTEDADKTASAAGDSSAASEGSE